MTPTIKTSLLPLCLLPRSTSFDRRLKLAREVAKKPHLGCHQQEKLFPR
jgi:hypothetical protein